MADFKLDKQRNKEDLERIREFFLEETGTRLSDFKAKFYLDFMLEEIGEFVYEQALADCHALMTDKIEDLFLLEYKKKR